jgi:hypothetical protein
MRLQFHCTGCSTNNSIELTSPLGSVLERIRDQGPWVALGDGETLEDQLHNELTGNEDSWCPDCGNPIAFSEESLAQFSRELLMHW